MLAADVDCIVVLTMLYTIQNIAMSVNIIYMFCDQRVNQRVSMNGPDPYVLSSAAISNRSAISLSASLLSSSCARDPEFQVSHNGASYLSTTGVCTGVLGDADMVAVAL